MIKVGKLKLYSNNLTSFEGTPEDLYIVGTLMVSQNNIVSFKGMPKGEYNRTILADNNDFRTLEGMPEVLNGNLYLDDNDNLRSLEGCPKIIKKSFECAGCPLTDLTHLPEYIGDDFWVGVDGEWFDEEWKSRSNLKNYIKSRIEVKGDILISIVRRDRE